MTKIYSSALFTEQFGNTEQYQTSISLTEDFLEIASSILQVKEIPDLQVVRLLEFSKQHCFCRCITEVHTTATKN